MPRCRLLSKAVGLLDCVMGRVLSILSSVSRRHSSLSLTLECLPWICVCLLVCITFNTNPHRDPALSNPVAPPRSYRFAIRQFPA